MVLYPDIFLKVLIYSVDSKRTHNPHFCSAELSLRIYEGVPSTIHWKLFPKNFRIGRLPYF